MKLPRRTFLRLAVGVAALPVAWPIARAQGYPSRPVHVIVATAAGGGNDIAARLIGQWLSEHFGQPFIIENRPGAGSNIGTEAVVRASYGVSLPCYAARSAMTARFSCCSQESSCNPTRRRAKETRVCVTPP
jgi:tripartite-type tricarboxylate transporter receptor subunit TctC